MTHDTTHEFEIITYTLGPGLAPNSAGPPVLTLDVESQRCYSLHSCTAVKKKSGISVSIFVFLRKPYGICTAGTAAASAGAVTALPLTPHWRVSCLVSALEIER